MNPVPRTAMAFLFATLLSVSTYPLLPGGVIAAMVAAACFVLALAVAANIKEIRAAGSSLGFTRGRVLPIAGLNFAAVFTLLAVLTAVSHGISQALAA